MANRAAPRPRRFSRHVLAGGAVLVLAGSCSAPVIPIASITPPPARQPMQTPGPMPTATPRLDWQDMSLAPGEWRWSNAGGTPTASFGQPGQPVAQLACTARTVTLTRYGSTASPRPAAVIRTTTTSRTVPARAQPGTISLTLDARDPLLDAIVFSRGRFALDVEGMAPLALPSWPEVARVIDDCRA